ncbi:uncharacterized protein DUF4328 [Kordia periserrulae]|uniref:Uncharacterized protein DUF4328 n=1 Tax=Kordia periserrulae TaxID=701523 RepID=A0A2T6BTZ9_9FLAO|nr:DUF4328 domain-containing protein [Kordia periserrulae]PTX59524.1 uncharacterized protein DUF4328 [Kordia periserrulae]
MIEHVKDNSSRSKDTILVFIVAACINVILILLIFYQNSLLQNFSYKREELESIEFLDLVLKITYVFRLVLYIVIIVFFVRWFKRAYGNLIRRHQPMEYSENGAAWGFFIPLLNFYRPYKEGKEIFLKTQYAIKELNSSFRIDKDATFVGLWWFLYIGSIFFESFAARVQEKAISAGDIDAFSDANGYVIASKVMTLIAIACALYFIHKISKLETTLRETSSTFSEIDDIGKAME